MQACDAHVIVSFSKPPITVPLTQEETETDDASVQNLHLSREETETYNPTQNLYLSFPPDGPIQSQWVGKTTG